MNKQVAPADLVTPKVTTGPLPASRKVYSTPESAPDLRVPLREIVLSEASGEPPLPVYDTTGPYTDDKVAIDVERGLKRTRIEWVKERGGIRTYQLRKYQRSNQSTCIDQRPAVVKGQKIKKGDIIADSSSTESGQLALGQNVVVAFLSWEGGNFEDAILISERLERMDRPSGLAEQHLVSIRISGVGEETDAAAQTRTDLAALRAIPGVVAASSTNQVTFGNSVWNTSMNHEEDQPQSSGQAATYMGGPGLVDTLGVRLVAGRQFEPEEFITWEALNEPGSEAGMAAVIVTRAFAEHMFPDEDPLGKQFYGWGSTPHRIVGVVEHLAEVLRTVPYDAALEAEDPLLADPPMHPSFEDRPGAPDRVFASVDDEAYEHLVEAWIEDPHDECLELCDPEKVTWDAIIHSVEDIEALPWPPRHPR